MGVSNSMRSVDRLLAIIEILSGYPEGVQVVKLAEKVGLPASTTHRALTNLLEQGYLLQDKRTKFYYLGPKMFRLAARLLDNLDVRRVSAPHLHLLAELTGQNPFLTIYDNQQLVATVVDTIGGVGQLKFFVSLGKAVPLHCTASGKVIAAFLPPEKQELLFGARQMERFTPHTCTDPDLLREEWVRIRQLGYAVCDEEIELGVAAIAAPIWDASDKVIGSVAVVGVKQAFEPPEKVRIAQRVVSAGIDISDTLGASKRIGQEAG